MLNERIDIAIDDDYRIRVLDPEKFKQTKQMEEESAAFTAKIREFNETVQSVVSVLESHAGAIEKVKLRAIGLRNRVEAEPHRRERLQQQLEQQISERAAELDKLQAQHDALDKVVASQTALIEKLTNHEA